METRGPFRCKICFRSSPSRQNGLNCHMEQNLFFHKNWFFHYFKWNSGGLGVSRRTARSVRCYLQSFSRFGGTWGRKVHFSKFSGKLTFQCSRNGPQNLPFCPGSLQDTFIIYSSIFHQHIVFKNNSKKQKIENWKSEISKTQVH